MKNLVLMTFIVAPFAIADPFQPKNIPAESQWHLHGDLTGLRKTDTGGFKKLIFRSKVCRLRKNWNPTTLHPIKKAPAGFLRRGLQNFGRSV